MLMYCIWTIYEKIEEFNFLYVPQDRTELREVQEDNFYQGYVYQGGWGYINPI